VDYIPGEVTPTPTPTPTPGADWLNVSYYNAETVWYSDGPLTISQLSNADGAGTYSEMTAGLYADTNTQGGLNEIDRFVIIFDTSTLPDNAVLDSATITLSTAQSDMDLHPSAGFQIGLTNGVVADADNIAASDYQGRGSTLLSDYLTVTSNYTGSQDYTFTLNTDGLNYVNKTSKTVLFGRIRDDIDQTFYGEWTAYNDSWLYHQAETPISLNISYHLGASPGTPCGMRVWALQTTSEGISNIYGRPVVVDGNLYGSNLGGKFYAANLSTETLLWVFNTTDPNWWGNDVTVGNGKVFASYFDYNGGTNSTLYALDMNSGVEIWDHSFGQVSSFSTLSEDGSLIFTTDYYSGTGTIYANNANTGAEAWSFSVGTYLSPSTEYNGVVYFSDQNGNVYAKSDSDGSEVWTVQLSQPGDLSYRGMFYQNGNLYVPGITYLYALSTSDGSETWNTTVGGSYNFGLINVVNDVLYVGNDNNHV
jgi:hypothetical protein